MAEAEYEIEVSKNKAEIYEKLKIFMIISFRY